MNITASAWQTHSLPVEVPAQHYIIGNLVVGVLVLAHSMFLHKCQFNLIRIGTDVSALALVGMLAKACFECNPPHTHVAQFMI
jgi:hypothetical protein